jgi:hypothetical protein
MHRRGHGYRQHAGDSNHSLEEYTERLADIRSRSTQVRSVAVGRRCSAHDLRRGQAIFESRPT